MTATATQSDIRPAIAAAIAALYASDARLLPPGGPPISGAAGIEAFWRGAMDLGIKAARLDTEELELHGTRVVEVGRYALEGDDQAPLDGGKYVVIWRQEEGEWRL